MSIAKSKSQLTNKNLVKVLLFVFLTFMSILLPSLACSSPEQDRLELSHYYQARFPHLALNDYSNGIYALDPIARQSWLAIEEFPPYEDAIDQGKRRFETAFNNGKRYADCFDHKGLGVSNTYPRWDKAKGEVVTLPQAINACRLVNGETSLPFDKTDMISLLAYMAYSARGKPIIITVPADDSRALAAYEQGKAFYYQRRGQLNFACATCHIQNVGKKLRSELLSPALGHVNNWPTYRLKWGEMGTLHRRFSECLTQTKSENFAEQSQVFRNLEYFLSYMGNGVPVSGPSTRK